MRMMWVSFLILFQTSVWAIEEFETVVRETKFNSSSRIVIDQDEIKKSHAKSLTSLLATQANISIAHSNFTPSSIYLRGGDSSHILILIDGVPFYDASTIQRTINLNSIDIKSVQKIEVIKGSQSVLYGGQALSGVIKIETIPNDLKDTGQVLAQLGSFHQSAVSAGVLKNLDELSAFVVRGSYSQKDAASPVLDSSKVYPTRLGTGEVAYINRNTDLQYLLKAQTSFDKTFIATTAFPAYSAADANNFETSTYQLNLTGLATMPASEWNPTLSLSTQKSARLFEQDFYSGQGSATKQDYGGELLSVRFDLTPVHFGSAFHLKTGLNFNQEKLIFKDTDVLKADAQTEFEGVFIKAESQIGENSSLEFGVRSDFNTMKNQINTYHAGLTLNAVKIEYSTGFKQPSLFQLFSTYGNTELQPEKSASFSASLENRLFENVFASITFFETRFDNLIIIRGSPQKYENVQSSKTKGVEASLTVNDPEQALTYTLNLGYQEPFDESQNTWLVRRPLRTGSLKIRKDYINFGAGLEVVHNGDRRDRTGSTSYGTISSYTLINLIADYKLDESLSFFSRAQNIGNQRYESSYGFYDEGLNIAAGVQYEF